MTTASLLIYNSPLVQVRCALECILRSDIAKVWVVYNGGDSAYERSLRSLCEESNGGRIEILTMPNRGYGAGHNQAIRKALALGADYHLVANADIRWQGDAIAPLAAYMDAHQEVGLVSPKITNPDGSLQYTARMLPTPWQLFGRRFLPFFFKGTDRKYQLEDLNHDDHINAPYLLGCFMLFRCETLRKEGLFDERFFMYPEDIDITRRIHRRWSTLYLPLSTIIHDHARESRHNLRMLLIHMANMFRYFNKWGWWRDDERSLFNRNFRSPLESGRTERSHN